MLGNSDMTPKSHKILPLIKNMKANHKVRRKRREAIPITFIATFCYNWPTYYCML